VVPTAQRACEFDGAAVQFDQPARQRQPQAGSLATPASFGIGLLEGLEDQGLVLLAHASSGILHRQQHIAGRAARRPEGHPAAAGGELDRVRAEVQQDLFQPALVAVQGVDPLANLRRQHQPGAFRARSQQPDGEGE
jgi:hypothetical protein